eukprot:m.485979 g.485979  ORF g.485979 m.485979 type:complete len:171 (+) comp24093_c0_seq1:261-773(+)
MSLLKRSDYGMSAGAGKLAARRRQLTDDERAEVSEAFELFDTDKDGALDYHELKVALRALGFEVKKAEVQKILREYDTGDQGLITERDFTEVVTERILERNPVEEVMKAFQLFDDDETGRVSVHNLRKVARELGEDISQEELKAMIDEFDRDGDGEISQEEFLAIMTSDY